MTERGGARAWRPSAPGPSKPPPATSRRALVVSCGVHALHDGYADILYVLLPLWQLEFGLGYAALGALRAVYIGLMAGLQVPSSMAAQRTSNVLILTVGTALAATGYLVAGASLGLALSLVFAGGAAGKLVCGFLGARLGVLTTVLLTEGLTAAGILALLPLHLHPGLALLPLIGIALNGTSSVLYGTVPELVSVERRQRAFGMFYTGTIGTGAVSPAIYGLFGDALGVTATMILVAGVVLVTLPLAWLLNPALQRLRANEGASA